MTVPRLKVTELFSKAILLPMFVYGDCMSVCSIFIHLSATGVAETAESSNLKGFPHSFEYIEYLHIPRDKVTRQQGR